MRKRYYNRVLLICVMVIGISTLAGCTEIDNKGIPEEQIVEYCVNAVINHDKNYIIKLQDREPEQETTTAWISDNPSDDTVTNETSGGENQADSNEETTAVVDSSVSMSKAMNISGVNFDYASYICTDMYPEGTDGFSMVAGKDKTLLVIKFNVTNVSSAPISLNIPELEYRFRCDINSDKRVNAQTTLLPNALNTWNDTLDAGQTKEMVLIYQIADDLSNNIKNISLSVATKNENYKVIIQ